MQPQVDLGHELTQAPTARSSWQALIERSAEQAGRLDGLGAVGLEPVQQKTMRLDRLQHKPIRSKHRRELTRELLRFRGPKRQRSRHRHMHGLHAGEQMQRRDEPGRHLGNRSPVGDRR